MFRDPITGEADYNIDRALTYGGQGVLFEEESIPEKIKKFKEDVRKKTLIGILKTDVDVYKFALKNRCLPKMSVEVLKELMKEDGKDPATTPLRVFVQGGGCSGFQYGLMFEENGANLSDKIYESDGVRIVVDPISIRYLEGAEVDFVDSPTGGGFTVKNPKATSTCGCGQSFSTD